MMCSSLLSISVVVEETVDFLVHVPEPVLKVLDDFVHRVKFPAESSQSHRLCRPECRKPTLAGW